MNYIYNQKLRLYNTPQCDYCKDKSLDRARALNQLHKPCEVLIKMQFQSDKCGAHNSNRIVIRRPFEGPNQLEGTYQDTTSSLFPGMQMLLHSCEIVTRSLSFGKSYFTNGWWKLLKVCFRFGIVSVFMQLILGLFCFVCFCSTQVLCTSLNQETEFP